MTTKNFNAKKMLMSAVAAVVFSFVFTTSANAGTTPQENTQRTNLEIRVKARPNGDSQKKQEQNKEQKQEQNKDQKQEKKQENKDIISSMLQMFGVRV